MQTIVYLLTKYLLAGLSICLLLTPIYAIFPCSADNEDASAMLLQAKEAWKQRKGKEAVSLFQQVIKLDPHNVDAHVNLGWVLFTVGKQKQGLKEELKAISIDPKNWEAHHIIAGIYIEAHQYALAAHHFRLCQKIDPKKGCNCDGMKTLMHAYPESSLSNKQSLPAK